ncbi:hypothetical protein FRC04_001930 [Tulasnella sp. 424]|nr:hypothetical protein FRC04_001930 [Tulasnella sp. 424]KAG8977707.1 hypothetical protein FRC05_000963 [Tulasnella sp. 425]
MPSPTVIMPPGSRTGYEWTARIRQVVSELGTPFTVHIFLGPIPEPPADPTTSPNCVASLGTYYDNDDRLIQSFVHLGPDLVEHRGFQTLEPENVVPYLKSNLKWCVTKGWGERVDLRDLPSLEVMVMEVPLTLSPGDIFPKIGPTKEHPDITRGKEGGAK